MPGLTPSRLGVTKTPFFAFEYYVLVENVFFMQYLRKVKYIIVSIITIF